MLVFAQLAIGEYLSKAGIAVFFNSFADGVSLNTLSIFLFFIFLVSAFIKCTQSGYIDDTALFFSGLNVSAGFYYSASSTALSIFFCASALTLFIGLLKNIQYTRGHDIQTGLLSRQTYLKESAKYPLKYSLAIICIDNYKNLYKVIGYFKMQKLIKMLALHLSKLEPDTPIYRYSADEFIMVLKNDNLKQSYEKLDNIRREIASSEFMFSHRQKGLKITISGCVSEKKRSDANATEVLLRARKNLQKTYQFTQNLISKA
jgi:diguanylate cyclase (GGDEF)-like protein